MSNYENDLSIDQGNLDKEWIKQPTLFMAYLKESIIASTKVTRAKENLDMVRSEVYLSTRQIREARGEKFTEAVLEAEVKSSKEYKEASDEYIDLLEKSKILEAAVRVFEHKKSALENMVKLHIAGYYSAPKDEGAGDLIAETSQQKQRDALNSKKGEKKNGNKK